MKILDCTLRDGGYYTGWDFEKSLVSTYLEACDALPVDYLEIGYRSIPMKGYLGEYFYCPEYILKAIKEKSSKKLVIILNEKDVNVANINSLLEPCIGLIDMVRVAIDPQNFKRSIPILKALKEMGFEVGANVMYMSTWKEQKDFLELLNGIDTFVDIFYMVDSFGGVYPEDVKSIYQLVREKTSVDIGFHGHNNLELGLINTLTAIECGATMVDATFTGMGRGAGNLKTELLLTALDSKNQLNVNFNALSKVVDGFTTLQAEYQWGTNLPYMVSGANSLPQKEVMGWVSKRYFSLNSIIRALSNRFSGIKDNIDLPHFEPEKSHEKVLIIGGGPSVKQHDKAINELLINNPKMAIIHASSRNVNVVDKVKNIQYHCLAGNEGHRLESTFHNIDINNRFAVLPPYPRTMGTYIPKAFEKKASQLKIIDFTDEHTDSITALVLQTALCLNAQTIYVVGYDGYHGNISKQELELFSENQSLFETASKVGLDIQIITPTRYTKLTPNSIYTLI